MIDENLIRQIEQIAVEEQRTPDQVIAEALRLYKAQSRKTSGVAFLLSIAGQGVSDEDDVSERDEAILATEIDPIHGWHPVKKDENSA